jgi:hypothetical protein
VFQFQVNPYCEEAEFLSVFNAARIGRIDGADLLKSTVDEFIGKDAFCLTDEIFDEIAPSDEIKFTGPISPDRRSECLRKCGLPQDD